MHLIRLLYKVPLFPAFHMTQITRQQGLQGPGSYRDEKGKESSSSELFPNHPGRLQSTGWEKLKHIWKGKAMLT